MNIGDTLACIVLNNNNNISWGMRENIEEHLTEEEMGQLREAMNTSAQIIVTGISREIKQSIAEEHGVNTEGIE